MTKPRPSGTKFSLSRACRWILALGIVKLGLLGSLLSFQTPEALESGAGFFNTGVRSVAHAASAAEAAQATATGGEIAPPAPQVRTQQSPFAQQPTSQVATAPSPQPPSPQASRPDQARPGQAPAPAVNPYVPRDSFQRKQEELNRREQELLALQQQMQTRLNELRTLEGKIETMLQQAGNVQDDKYKHLIDVYTNMKPKQAAEVLATLDERIAVKILAGMRGKQAGEVLSYMQAAPAAKLSELLSRTQINP